MATRAEDELEEISALSAREQLLLAGEHGRAAFVPAETAAKSVATGAIEEAVVTRPPAEDVVAIRAAQPVVPGTTDEHVARGLFPRLPAVDEPGAGAVDAVLATTTVDVVAAPGTVELRARLGTQEDVVAEVELVVALTAGQVVAARTSADQVVVAEAATWPAPTTALRREWVGGGNDPESAHD